MYISSRWLSLKTLGFAFSKDFSLRAILIVLLASRIGEPCGGSLLTFLLNTTNTVKTSMKTLMTVSMRAIDVHECNHLHQWDEISKPERCCFLHGDSDERGKTTNVCSPVVPITGQFEAQHGRKWRQLTKGRYGLSSALNQPPRPHQS